MECAEEVKPLPVPAPTPSMATSLQRTAWLQMAVSQQRAWLLETLNQSNDRTTHAIEESCKAMEERLLLAAGFAENSEGISTEMTHVDGPDKPLVLSTLTLDGPDKIPEPSSEPPPAQPALDSARLWEKNLLRRTSARRTPHCKKTHQRQGTKGRIEAWVTGAAVDPECKDDGPDVVGEPGLGDAGDAEFPVDDDPSTTRKSSKGGSLYGAVWGNRPSSNTRKLNQHHNQIRQLIGSHRNVRDDLDPKSLRGKLDICFQGRFDTFVGVLIIVNTMIMFVQLQYYGQVSNASVGLGYVEWAHAEDVFHGFEMFFSAIFLAEFLARVYVYRCRFFLEAFNILDAIIVPLTAMDTFLISNLEMTFSNVSFIRLIRMFRVVRAFRVMRTMGHFKELRLLMHTIVASVLALFWSMLIMFIFQLMTAILLCQTLHDFINDPTEDLEMRLWANQYYGSGLKALYTVFELTFSGCWPNYARPVIERVHPSFVIIFVTYVTAVVFALTRIVSAMFLKETLQQASHAAEIMVKEKLNDTKVVMANLRALFMAADADGDGQLTQDELARVLGFEKVRLWLAKLGVDASDPKALFSLLDVDGSGQISSETFVTCVKKLKGEARAQDLIPVVQDCRAILNHCKALREEHRKLSTLLSDREQEEHPATEHVVQN